MKAKGAKLWAFQILLMAARLPNILVLICLVAKSGFFFMPFYVMGIYPLLHKLFLSLIARRTDQIYINNKIQEEIF